MQFRCLFALMVCAGLMMAETPDAGAARAIQEIEAGRFADAAAILRPLVKQTPQQPDLWNLLGICESELGNTGAARTAFERGLKLAPSSVSINENLGNLLFRSADYQEARQYLAKALALGSEKPEVAFSLAASQIRTGEEKQGLAALVRIEEPLAGRAEYWTERGWVELREDAAAADRSFGHALALAPGDLRALNGAASAAEAQHDDEKALSLLLQAKKVAPDDLRTLLHFGTVCLRRDLSVDALDALEHARKIAPENNLALFLYARAQIAFQQWRESHDLFTELDKRVPNYAPAQYALGWLDVKLNRPAEARKHLEASLAIAPENADAQYELGQLDLEDGNLAAAETRLQAVLDRNPRHARALVAYGDLAMRRGNLPDAKSRYEAAIEAEPKTGSAHYKLSTVLMRLGEKERAEKERALGASLNAEAVKRTKTVLVLSDPEGRLLTGDPKDRKGGA
jgi:tetratricopeptide (TPR) repeat protein